MMRPLPAVQLLLILYSGSNDESLYSLSVSPQKRPDICGTYGACEHRNCSSWTLLESTIRSSYYESQGYDQIVEV